MLILIIVLVSLGLWQLRRLDEKQLANQVGLSRSTSAALDLEAMVSGAGSDLDTLEYRRATTRGVWDATYEVYVRSQVRDGRSGLWVVTPLILSDGRAVMVNRGWIPVELDRGQAAPPVGEAEVTGTVRASRRRSSLGPTDRPGIEDTIARVDLQVLDGFVPQSLLGVYLEESSVNLASWPLRLDPPTFDEEGPHLLYAVQWFSFALVTLVGYGALIRSKAHRRHRPAKSPDQADS